MDGITKMIYGTSLMKFFDCGRFFRQKVSFWLGEESCDVQGNGLLKIVLDLRGMPDASRGTPGDQYGTRLQSEKQM